MNGQNLLTSKNFYDPGIRTQACRTNVTSSTESNTLTHSQGHSFNSLSIFYSINPRNDGPTIFVLPRGKSGSVSRSVSRCFGFFRIKPKRRLRRSYASDALTQKNASKKFVLQNLFYLDSQNLVSKIKMVVGAKLTREKSSFFVMALSYNASGLAMLETPVTICSELELARDTAWELLCSKYGFAY